MSQTGTGSTKICSLHSVWSSSPNIHSSRHFWEGRTRDWSTRGHLYDQGASSHGVSNFSPVVHVPDTEKLMDRSVFRGIQGWPRARADGSTGPARTNIDLLQAREAGFCSKGRCCLQHCHLTRQDGGKEMGPGPTCWEAWRTESPSCSAAKQTLHSCHFTTAGALCTADQRDTFLPGWFMHSHIMKCISKGKDFSVSQQSPLQVSPNAGCVGCLLGPADWPYLHPLCLCTSGCPPGHTDMVEMVSPWDDFLVSKRGFISHARFCQDCLNSVFSLGRKEVQSWHTPCFLWWSVAYMLREKQVSVLIIPCYL